MAATKNLISKISRGLREAGAALKEEGGFEVCWIVCTSIDVYITTKKRLNVSLSKWYFAEEATCSF